MHHDHLVIDRVLPLIFYFNALYGYSFLIPSHPLYFQYQVTQQSVLGLLQVKLKKKKKKLTPLPQSRNLAVMSTTKYNLKNPGKEKKSRVLTVFTSF